MLDDPYHPEHAALLQRDHGAIEAALSSSAEAKAHARAQRALSELDIEAMALELESAAVERLTRAHETLALEAALHARGGPELAHYRALLECERAAPETAPPEQPRRDDGPRAR
jgi:hypothetical protein